MRQTKRIGMMCALAGMRDCSEVYMGEVSEEYGGDVIPAPIASTGVQTVYQVVLDAMGKVCSLYCVVLKYGFKSHEDNAGSLRSEK